MSEYMDVFRSIAGSLIDKDQIKIPEDFHAQCIEIDDLFKKSDKSGMVSSLLDFAINASLVDYNYTSDKSAVADALNDSMNNINENLLGKVPTGIRAFAKQWFIERFKGSSLMITNVIWKKDENGVFYPYNMWVTKGRDVLVEVPKDIYQLGSEKYYFCDKNGKKGSPITDDFSIGQTIFVQKPMAFWSDPYPVPFMISRGLLFNAKLLDHFISKGSRIVSEAVLMLLMKKGNQELAKSGNPAFVYSEDDLKNSKDSLIKVLREARVEGKTAVYTSQFDTEIQQIIPQLEDAVSSTIYAPVEKRILSGLGIIDVNLTGSRDSGILNPKAFVSMIEEGIEDFKILLRDIGKQSIIFNRKNKTQNYIRDLKLDVSSGVVNEFFDDKLMNHIRGMYDRGVISKRTYSELNGMGYVDLTNELTRKQEELKDKDIWFPPVIQNNGQVSPDSYYNENNKKVVESKVDLESVGKTSVESKNFELAIYHTIEDLPSNLDVLPKKAKKLWLNTFNAVLKDTKDENSARAAAWSNVKRDYSKNESTGKWTKNETSAILLVDEESVN